MKRIIIHADGNKHPENVKLLASNHFLQHYQLLVLMLNSEPSNHLHCPVNKANVTANIFFKLIIFIE